MGYLVHLTRFKILAGPTGRPVLYLSLYAPGFNLPPERASQLPSVSFARRLCLTTQGPFHTKRESSGPYVAFEQGPALMPLLAKQ